MPDIRSIAVAVDGSKPAKGAVDWAISLAKLAGARLTIVGVVPPPIRSVAGSGEVVMVPASENRYFPELLSRYADDARRSGVRPVAAEVLKGHVVDELLTFLDEHRPDVMVLGARGLSRTRRLLLGSVSDAVVHHAKGSVLIVRSPA